MATRTFSKTVAIIPAQSAVYNMPGAAPKTSGMAALPTTTLRQMRAEKVAIGPENI